MKAIFPCLGSLIMTKTDIEKLKEFYDSRQLGNNNSTSNIVVENNSLNYFNDNSELVLDNVTPLTVSKLKKVLGISSNSPSKEPGQIQNQSDEETLIDDDSIMSNPFFTTLKPVD